MGNYSGTVNSAMVGPVKTGVTGIGAITGTDQVYSTLTAGDVTPVGRDGDLPVDECVFCRWSIYKHYRRDGKDIYADGGGSEQVS